MLEVDRICRVQLGRVLSSIGRGCVKIAYRYVFRDCVCSNRHVSYTNPAKCIQMKHIGIFNSAKGEFWPRSPLQYVSEKIYNRGNYIKLVDADLR